MHKAYARGPYGRTMHIVQVDDDGDVVGPTQCRTYEPQEMTMAIRRRPEDQRFCRHCRRLERIYNSGLEVVEGGARV